METDCLGLTVHSDKITRYGNLFIRIEFSKLMVYYFSFKEITTDHCTINIT